MGTCDEWSDINWIIDMCGSHIVCVIDTAYASARDVVGNRVYTVNSCMRNVIFFF